jgi:tRNA G37 N-methylase TrmD
MPQVPYNQCRGGRTVAVSMFDVVKSALNGVVKAQKAHETWSWRYWLLERHWKQGCFVLK